MPQPQAAPAPEAPAAPAAPTAPAAPVAATPLAGVPSDVRAFNGLRTRRELLTKQLERATERRGELARELANTDFTEGAARRGLEQRLGVVDEQVVQLERDIVATDRQLAAAPPGVLAQTQEQQEPVVVRTGSNDDEVAGVAFGTFLLGMLVMLLAGRIRRWRRRGDRAAARGGAAGDPRIEQLTQAVEAIAVEVERIGEGQRFVTRLLAEGRAAGPQGDPGRAAEAAAR